MNTRIHIHEHGSMLTVRITSMAMASPISATLSGPLLYALVDGLLWWCINRKLDALVACAQGQRAPADRNDALEFGAAMVTGEDLVMRCFTTPFHEHGEERQERIVAYIGRELPKLRALTYGPHHATATAELAELMELCTILQQRIANPMDAMLGLESMVEPRTAAAA